MKVKKSKKNFLSRNTIVAANWLNPQKTLREHGILESEILLVKRKYFYSDVKITKE